MEKMDVWYIRKDFNQESVNNWDLRLKMFQNIFRVHLLFIKRIKKMMNCFTPTVNFFIWQDTKIWMNSFHIQRKVFETWSGRINKNRWNPASGNRLTVAMKMTIFIFIWEKVTALIFLFLTMEELWRRLNMAGCFM